MYKVVLSALANEESLEYLHEQEIKNGKFATAL